MGAYLQKPVTEKTSDSGEYTYCGRKITFASTAMQGWRISMEDAHSVIPHFDEDSSLFAVYDGHGEFLVDSKTIVLFGSTLSQSKEVAVYCANRIGEMIKSTKAYKEGDMTKALKEAFIACDKKLLLPEVAQELKRIANDTDKEEIDSAPEDLDELVAEATMPLKALMERYGKNEEKTDSSTDSDKGGGEKGSREGEVKNILQILCDNAGIDIEFEDSDGSESETDPSLEPDESDLTSDEDLSHSASHDTPQETSGDSSHDTPKETSGDSSHDTPKETSSDSSHDTPVVSGTCAPGSLTALLQSRPGRSVPEVSKMETMEEERSSSPPKPHPPDNPPPVKKESSFVETVSGPNSTVESSQTAATTSGESPASDSESKPDSLNTESSSKGDSNPEKSKVLKDLLTAGVDNGLPIMVEENRLRGSLKRPYPQDGNEELLSPQTFCKRREHSEEGHESGTTAVVCLLRGRDVFVANAGDSRCVLSSKGKAVELSFDHKPTDPLELERIKRAGGRVGSDGRVNRGLNLSRAIGDHLYKQEASLSLEEQMISPLPDVETAVLDEDSEFIVLACDGIWNCKTSQEVVDYVRERLVEKADSDTLQQDLTAICEALCDECMARNTDNDGTGCDNMTCILVLLKSLKQGL